MHSTEQRARHDILLDKVFEHTNHSLYQHINGISQDPKPCLSSSTDPDKLLSWLRRKNRLPAIRRYRTPWYSFPDDTIFLRNRNAYPDRAAWYHSFFHQIIHSTGHRARLDRKEIGLLLHTRRQFVLEELTAELGAAYLCAFSGIGQDTMAASAKEIAALLRKLPYSVVLLIKANYQAYEAVDWLLSGIPAQPTTA